MFSLIKTANVRLFIVLIFNGNKCVVPYLPTSDNQRFSQADAANFFFGGHTLTFL